MDLKLLDAAVRKREDLPLPNTIHTPLCRDRNICGKTCLFQLSILWRFPTGLAGKVENVVFAVAYSHGTCQAIHQASLNQLSHIYTLCVPTNKMKESGLKRKPGFLPWRSSWITGKAEGYTYNCRYNGCYSNHSPKNYLKVVFKRHWKLAIWLHSLGLA